MRRLLHKYSVAALTAGIGVAAAVLGSVAVGNLEEAKVRSEFQQKATLRAKGLAHALAGSFSNLDSIVDFFGAFPNADREQFRSYVIPALTREREIEAIEWLVRVPYAQRTAHEAATQRVKQWGYTIMDGGGADPVVPAGPREEYFPIHYRESLKDPAPRATLGLDMAAKPAVRQALDQARDTGIPTATGRVALASTAGTQTGFLVVLPVYRRQAPLPGVAERREHLLGFVAATYHIGALIETAMIGTPPEGLNFKVIDQAATGSQRALHFHKSRTLSEREYPVEDESDIRAGLHFATTITVAGRSWELLFYPTEKYLAARMTTRRWEMLAAGLVVTSLLTLYLVSAVSRTARVERLVAARTAELSQEIAERRRAEEAATRAREEAERASRVKTDFLATMSHEIRTPMNGVIGMLGLLLDTELSNRQRDFAETARSSAEALLSLINDILDFSKVEAGKMTLESIPFDLRLAIDEVAELLAVKARDKSLDVIVRYPADAPRYVVGDPGRVRQILLNLASNAIKFTEVGHVLVNVDCQEQNEQSALLRVAVEDTGIGIPSDKLDLVFDKFTQSDTSTTRRYGGTGLGLAICKQLVTLMGGTIGVESTLGRGSTFWFTLRVPLTPPLAAASVPAAELKGVRVLIVDDNDVNRRVLHEQIVSWGMRNGSAESGKAALTRLREAQAAGDPYQIALVDLQMPEMDGETLGRLVKADPALKDVALIMLTSLGDRNDTSTLEAAGFAGFLVKPVRQSQLMDALATVWAARTAGRPIGLVTLHSVVASRAAAKEARRPTGAPLHARVLLVEDNPTNQKIGVLMLEKLGCRVDVAGNGREAVDMISMAPYDVVLMDCQMPEMDGYEATAEIRRRDGQTPWRAPIIAMTANAMQGDREKCLAAGMDDYVSKPITLAELERVLRRWLKIETAPVPPAISPTQPDVATTLDPVGFGQFMDLANEAPSLLEELLATFLSEADARLGEMRQAVELGENHQLGDAAHTLKGSSSGLGAPAMANLCHRIEQLAREESVADVPGLLDRLTSELGRVREELQIQLQQGTRS